MSGGPEIHGPVESCAVAFVQDSVTTCEACSLVGRDAKACSREYAPRGYFRKCRTGPHSPLGEVWCMVTPPPKVDVPLKPHVILSIIVGVAIVLSAAFVLVTRWRRS